jgi:ATP-dependent protease HslVU (ClpYQ) peptidase subunit
MTTVIACRPLLTMVADSRISHGDGKFTSRKKIQKVGKFLAGVAGDYAPALTYLKNFANTAREMDGKTVPSLPAFEGEFELLVLSEFGLWIYGEDGTPIEVEEEIYAIGTGSGFANACLRTQELMLQPCNLAMALEVACEYDPGSSLPMVELTLARRKRLDTIGHAEGKRPA